MNGIVTFTIATGEVAAETLDQLTGQVAALGFKPTIPCSEGGRLALPEGTYASLLAIENKDEQLRSLYRALVEVMRTLSIKGKYFISMAHEPVMNICGEL